MHSFNIFVEGLKVGMIIIGVSLYATVGNLKSYDRCVTVKGLCEKEELISNYAYPFALQY